MGKSVADLDQLYEQYLDEVFSYVLQRVHNSTDAEDITAETFAAAMTAFHRFRGDSRPLAWLLGIARQKIAEATRQRELHRRWDLPMDGLTDEQRDTLWLLLRADLQKLPEDAALRKEARTVMRQLLETLSEPQREALLLQVEQDLPIEAIARILGRKVGATKSLLQRGRNAIFRQGQGYFKD